MHVSARRAIGQTRGSDEYPLKGTCGEDGGLGVLVQIGLAKACPDDPRWQLGEEGGGVGKAFDAGCRNDDVAETVATALNLDHLA